MAGLRHVAPLPRPAPCRSPLAENRRQTLSVPILDRVAARPLPISLRAAIQWRHMALIKPPPLRTLDTGAAPRGNLATTVSAAVADGGGSSDQVPTGPTVFPRTVRVSVSEVYDSYWRFAAERQAIFYRRMSQLPRPWTTDAVLAKYKFTNAYRASDRTSQYLIRNVIYRADLPNTVQEVVFRVLLFKLFNRIETWELLEQTLGSITFAAYSSASYDDVLSRARAQGRRLYSAAYIMPPGGSYGSSIKHRNHLALLERMMRERLPDRLAETRTMREGFALLRGYPMVGDFLAYQLITDINYSECTDFSEMEFVVPGPGARDGLRKCFVDQGGLDECDLIRLVADIQDSEFERLGLEFQSLWGRQLQLIDCQSLFCEVDKYARMRHPHIQGRSKRSRIKQTFDPKATEVELFYPPKWGLNTTSCGLPLLDAAEPRDDRATTRTQEDNGIGFNSYQEEALRTDRTESDEKNGVIVPMLGLAGEAGQLLSEYKKRLRDGDTHVCFKDRVREELGDLLWYLANVASKFGVELEDIARANLNKVRARWSFEVAGSGHFDGSVPEDERLPRRFCVDLMGVEKGGRQQVRVSVDGFRFGDELTDNAYRPDGYRFHDVFHFAYAAVLEWSPITRSLLRRKRKSRPELDEVEDGGRAAAIEEGVSALVFDYARRHQMLRGVKAVDDELLRTVKGMTSHLEVNRCTTGEWEKAILQGFDVWREVVGRGGGRVLVDLDERRIQYLGWISSPSPHLSGCK